MGPKLQGRVAMFTGGASGIGAATAKLFAEEGARIVLVDRDPGGLERTAREIDGEVRCFIADVTDADAVGDIVKDILNEWLRIDILMTCAGISTVGTAVTVKEEDFDRILEVNVKGSFICSRAVLPNMIQQGSGAIVLVSSQQAFNTDGNNVAYIASKGAIVSMTRAMAVDHALDGIRVNAVVPGWIDTPMSRAGLQLRFADPEAARKRRLERHAMGRYGFPDEVARAALFLASDDASFTTGSMVFVDGGWTAK